MTGYLGTTVIAVVTGSILLWLALVILLVVTRPADLRVTDILRLLPDVVGLLRRIAADPQLPRGVRIRLGLLLVYLILPIDLIPDFIPVLARAQRPRSGIGLAPPKDFRPCAASQGSQPRSYEDLATGTQRGPSAPIQERSGRLVSRQTRHPLKQHSPTVESQVAMSHILSHTACLRSSMSEGNETVVA